MLTVPSQKGDSDIQRYVERFGHAIPSYMYSERNREDLLQRVRSALKSGKPDPEIAKGREDNALLPAKNSN